MKPNPPASPKAKEPAPPVAARDDDVAGDVGGDVADVNFLPTWYPKVVRSRRRLRRYATLAVTCIACAGGLAFWRQGEVHASRERLTRLDKERQTEEVLLADLDGYNRRLSDLLRQAEVRSRVGVPVRLGGVVAMLERHLPRGGWVTHMHAQHQKAADVPAARPRGRNTPVPAPEAGSLVFRVAGLVPEEQGIAVLYEGLRAEPRLTGVEVVYSRSASAPARMTEFEVVFSVPLVPPM